jgi:hypothetical protein
MHPDPKKRKRAQRPLLRYGTWDEVPMPANLLRALSRERRGSDVGAISVHIDILDNPFGAQVRSNTAIGEGTQL